MLIVPPAPFGARGTSMINALRNLGLTTNLKVCLDAGDAGSYSSGQTWIDLSGSGTHFYRGSGSGSDGADPTFSGTPGNESSSEYFSVDGGDYFTLVGSNPSWVDSFHKSGAQFSFAAWLYVNGATSTSVDFCDVGDTVSTQGFTIGSSGSSLRALDAVIYDGSGGIIYFKTTTAQANNGAWNFLAASVDMSSGVTNFQVNATSEHYTGQSFTGTPSTSAAPNALQIAAGGGGSIPDASGMRYQCVAMWNVGLTTTQLAAIYGATKAKFGF